MGWTARVIIAIVVLLIIGTGALGYMESIKPPVQQTVEQPVTLPSGG